MAVKSFIRGDFRTLVIDNDYPTNYKVYYNGRWNYIQDEESFIKRLDPSLGESYLNRFNLKVLDNNQWVRLAILDNYYNKNEKRNSIFYRTITRENFNFKPRAVNFTEMDARLGLNNLQTPFASNEIKYNKEEIENLTNKIEKDEVLYKIGNLMSYNELNTIKYISNEKDNFENNTNINFLENHSELDHFHIVEELMDKKINEEDVIEHSSEILVSNNGITFRNDKYLTTKVTSVTIDNYETTLNAGSNTDYAGGIFHFFDENDELIKQGKVITDNYTSAETENFLIKVSSGYGNSYHSCVNIFRDDADTNLNGIPNSWYVWCSGVGDLPNQYVELTFKTPQYITRIIANPASMCVSGNTYQSGCYSNICVINLHYEDGTTVKRRIVSSSVNDVKNVSTEFFYETQNLNYFVVKVNNLNSDLFKKQKVFGENLKNNHSTFKFAISKDNVDYFTFKNNNWNNIDKNDSEILSNGMDQSEFENISEQILIDKFGNFDYLYLYVSIVNNSINEDQTKFIKFSEIFDKESKQNFIYTDQVLINNFTTSDQNAGGIFRFYDENGDLIESGNILSASGTRAESENFIMESYDYWTKTHDYNMFGIANAFRTDEEKSAQQVYQKLYSTEQYFDTKKAYASVKFKTFKKISKIEYNIKTVNYYGVNTESCDINILFDGNIMKKISVNSLEPFNVIQNVYDFNPNFYHINEIGLIKTYTNQIKNVNNIEKIKISANELQDTKFRIALSTDSNNTYLKFNGTNWDTIKENDIINNGNTINEINSLTYQDFSYLDLTNKTLDFVIYMKTLDSSVTPNIEKIEVITKDTI